MSSRTTMDLTDKITLTMAAVENWGRLNLREEDARVIRFALLDTIREEGVLSDEPPAWMQQARAGVDKWLLLPGDLALALKDDSKGPRPWRATNCIGCRRRPGRKQSREMAPAKEPQLSEENYQSFAAMAYEQQKESIYFSLHCYDRLRERIPTFADYDNEQLLSVLQTAMKTAVFEPAPWWANLSGKNPPVMLLDYTGDKITDVDADSVVAVVLGPVLQGDKSVTAVTAVASKWAQDDFSRLQEDPSGYLHISKETRKKLKVQDPRPVMATAQIIKDETVYATVVVDGQKHKLRLQLDSSRAKHRWIASL